jgi:hypothetical protein
MPMRHYLATVVLAAATAYCADGEHVRGADLSQPSGQQPQQSVPVTRLAAGAESFTYYSELTESTRLVIRDASAWAEMWARLSTVRPVPPLPTVDFNREMVVVTALGARPSGGHSIVVEGASREGGTVYVTVRSETPGSGCLLSQALTSPVDVARMPRTDDPVQFRERTVTRGC